MRLGDITIDGRTAPLNLCASLENTSALAELTKTPGITVHKPRTPKNGKARRTYLQLVWRVMDSRRLVKLWPGEGMTLMIRTASNPGDERVEAAQESEERRLPGAIGGGMTPQNSYHKKS
jgi:hypothetical protein